MKTLTFVEAMQALSEGNKLYWANECWIFCYGYIQLNDEGQIVDRYGCLYDGSINNNWSLLATEETRKDIERARDLACQMITNTKELSALLDKLSKDYCIADDRDKAELEEMYVDMNEPDFYNYMYGFLGSLELLEDEPFDENIDDCNF